MKSLDKNRLFLWHYILAMFIASALLYTMSTIEYKISSRVIYKTFGYILFATLGGPIIETIFVQFIPFKILEFLKIRNYYIILFLLTMLFSVLHQRFFDNLILFALFTFGCSVIVNYFLQIIKRENTKKAVYKTIIFHGTYNTTILLLSYLYKHIQ